jgi:single-strand DNA-binding protein
VSATEITVVGNVVNSPQRVRLASGSSVTNFRLAATERRFDRERQEYVDGNTFWVDVECFNELGGNVSRSVSKGDPVVVVGTISTHQWESDQGRRSRPQIRAEAIGPNLARGTADFAKGSRATTAPEQNAPPADQPSDEDIAAEAVLRAGRDYETDPATLHGSDSDTSVPEPALR